MVYHSFPGLKAVLFDLDGTLVDSAPDLLSALNRLLAAEGRARIRLEQVKMMIGDGVRKLVDRGFSATGASPSQAELGRLTRAFIADYEANATVETRLFPGVTETLAGLRAAGLALGVCTNKPEAATREILSALAIESLFAAVVGGDTVPGAAKPDPRPVRALIERLGADSSAALMVGDSPNDIEAARRARIPVIAVRFGYTRTPPDELGADRLIGHFKELPGVLAETWAARGRADRP
ncbi:MAG: phosphoglycolate phosphatase [Alphaproteobacteria bacterium]|nr:phosphoglycolate phosphatase [Alphaproteobacteria bacterium]